MNPDFPPNGGPLSPIDLDQIPQAPNRGSRHCRAHSDTFFGFPDDFLFEVSDLDLTAIENPAFANNPNSAAPMAVESCRSDCTSNGNKCASTTGRPPPPIGHLRILSMDAEGISFGTAVFDGGDSAGKSAPLAVPSPSGEKRAGFHRRNRSMDGPSSSFEADLLMDGSKNAMTRDNLAELALIDPKKANRILSNRQSAAHSKERRIRYTSELERKVQTLQTEATTLSAQVTMLQQDTTGQNAENRELKLRLQSLEQQAQLKDDLNDTLKEEVQRLRITAGQIPPTNFSTPNRNSNPFGGQQPGFLHFNPRGLNNHQ